MNILQAIILGIIQGLTEFLPVSSSGHLTLFQRIFGLSEGVATFDIAVHFATLIAVVIVLWKDIVEIIKKPFGKLPILIVISTIPAVLFGVKFKDQIELALKGATLGYEFIFTGAILLYAEFASKKSKNKELEQTTVVDAGIIGIAQAIAILPAVSRSGATLAGALFRGLNREFAIKFSFLMSIPVILGPALIDAIKLGKDAAKGVPLEVPFIPMVFGMIAAGISGYIAVRFMLKIFTKASLKYFSYYVIILGVLILVDQNVTHIINWR